MAISYTELHEMLVKAFPNALIEMEDTRGDADHYQVRITSPVFHGLTRVAQHQMVYAALGDLMAGRLHALSLKTQVPAKE